MGNNLTRRTLLSGASAFVSSSALAAGKGGIKLHGHPPVVTIPVITSNGGGATATVNLLTSQTAVTTVTATGTTPIVYSKSGTDTALFSINSSSGVLALLTTQPVGSYSVTVTATNSAGHDDQAITVIVLGTTLILEDNSTILQLEDNSNLVVT